MTTERFSDSVLRLDVRQDSDNEVGEIHDLDAREQLLKGSESVKLLEEGQSQRRRGTEPAERESSKLKRLLRNRVSAQKARERKKVYVNELEKKVKDLETKNTELEERLSTLQKENHMLRHIIKNTSSSSSL